MHVHEALSKSSSKPEEVKVSVVDGDEDSGEEEEEPGSPMFHNAITFSN